MYIPQPPYAHIPVENRDGSSRVELRQAANAKSVPKGWSFRGLGRVIGDGYHGHSSSRWPAVGRWYGQIDLLLRLRHPSPQRWLKKIFNLAQETVFHSCSHPSILARLGFNLPNGWILL